MPRNIPTTQTPDTLATYAIEVEQRLARLRRCEQQLREHSIPATTAFNDDSFKQSMVKLSRFLQAVEESVSRDVLATIRAAQEGSPKHSVSAKKKKGRPSGG